MAVFDPNDWWERRSGFKSSDRGHRRSEEINREVATRWLASVSLCLCFAALAPVEHLGVSFAALLTIAGIASCGLALLQKENFYSTHLTPWDEAIWSLSAGLALWLWCAPQSLGTL